MTLSNLTFTFQAFAPANIIFTGIGVLLLVRLFCRYLCTTYFYTPDSGR